MTLEPMRDRPRIFRFTIRTPGHRASALVKCPLPEKDVADSIFGLQQALAQLQLERRISSFAVSAPIVIKDSARDRLTRWPVALDAAIGRLDA